VRLIVPRAVSGGSGGSGRNYVYVRAYKCPNHISFPTECVVKYVQNPLPPR